MTWRMIVKSGKSSSGSPTCSGLHSAADSEPVLVSPSGATAAITADAAVPMLNRVFGVTAVCVGAGTVLRTDDVASVRDAGGRLIVMPHSDGDVIRRAKELNLVCTPGVATPTEAFAALRNGADGLKMFPAENLPPAVAKAWRAVLAPDTLLIPVGGITPETMKPYIAAGADGFGLGSALFAPDRTLNDIKERAELFAESWRSTTGGAARAG